MAYWSHVGKVDFWQCPQPKDSRGIKCMGEKSLTPSPRHLWKARLFPLELRDSKLIHANLSMKFYMQLVSPQPSPQPPGIPIPHTHQISLSVNPKGRARKC